MFEFFELCGFIQTTEKQATAQGRRLYAINALRATFGGTVASGEPTSVKSLEQQLNEQAEELRQLRGAGGKSTTVAQLLSESGLPPSAQARLRKRIPITEKADVVKAAITDEKEYIRKLGLQGTQNQGADSARLVESYKFLGLSEKESKLAAGVEVAVTNVTEARQKLANAGKLLGLTDAQAAVFSEI